MFRTRSLRFALDPMKATDLAEKTDSLDWFVQLSDETFSWCLRNAEVAVARRQWDKALLWCRIAGEVGERFSCSFLASERMESILQSVGSALSLQSHRVFDLGRTANLRWLHVLTRSFDHGGHTALCRRWIELDESGDTHDLVLTHQVIAGAAVDLVECVRGRGGSVNSLENLFSMMARAEKLGQLAADSDVVVLHTHMWDPLPSVALSRAGTPLVLAVNHADHIYWTGVGVVDMILNIRQSGESLCKRYRGREESFRIPIPIPAPKVRKGDRIGVELRARLGIPEAAPVFLTIGRSVKYRPMHGLSFFDAAQNILKAVEGAYLIAVGPKPDEELWQRLVRDTEGKTIVVGVQTDINPYLAAADIYLEGFPFGSLTALLEAVLAGVAPVLAPGECPLPYRSDDLALDDLLPPATVSDYVIAATSLARNADIRQALASDLSKKIETTHCETAWRMNLDMLRNMLSSRDNKPRESISSIERLPKCLTNYWAHYVVAIEPEDAFSFARAEAMYLGLRPLTDTQIRKGLREARLFSKCLPHPAKAAVSCMLMAMLPEQLAKRVYFRK